MEDKPIGRWIIPHHYTTIMSSIYHIIKKGSPSNANNVGTAPSAQWPNEDHGDICNEAPLNGTRWQDTQSGWVSKTAPWQLVR